VKDMRLGLIGLGRIGAFHDGTLVLVSNTCRCTSTGPSG
jgi:hypothetical protein